MPAQCYIPDGAAITAGFIMGRLSERDQPSMRLVRGGRPGSKPEPGEPFAPADGPWAGEGEDRPACESADPDLFFPSRGALRAPAEARRLCAGCPRRTACLDDALDQGDQWAVRGGLTPEERRRRYAS